MQDLDSNPEIPKLEIIEKRCPKCKNPIKILQLHDPYRLITDLNNKESCLMEIIKNYQKQMQLSLDQIKSLANTQKNLAQRAAFYEYLILHSTDLQNIEIVGEFMKNYELPNWYREKMVI